MNQCKLMQRGVGLVELILSISIISAILILATRYYFQTTNNQEINHSVSEIASVVTALQAWDRGNSDFSALATNGITQLYNAGFIAKTNDLVLATNNGTTTATLNNAWGQAINVVGRRGSATISTTTATDYQCQALVNNFQGSSCSAANGFSYVFQ